MSKAPPRSPDFQESLDALVAANRTITAQRIQLLQAKIEIQHLKGQVQDLLFNDGGCDEQNI